MSRSERGKLAGIPGLASKRKERGTTKSVCVPMVGAPSWLCYKQRTLLCDSSPSHHVHAFPSQILAFSVPLRMVAELVMIKYNAMHTRKEPFLCLAALAPFLL